MQRTSSILGRDPALRTPRVRGPEMGRTCRQGERGCPVRVVLRLVHAWGVEAQPVGVAPAVLAPAVLARAVSADPAAV